MRLRKNERKKKNVCFVLTQNGGYDMTTIYVCRRDVLTLCSETRRRRRRQAPVRPMRPQKVVIFDTRFYGIRTSTMIISPPKIKRKIVCFDGENISSGLHDVTSLTYERFYPLNASVSDVCVITRLHYP